MRCRSPVMLPVCGAVFGSGSDVPLTLRGDCREFQHVPPRRVCACACDCERFVCPPRPPTPLSNQNQLMPTSTAPHSVAVAAAADSGPPAGSRPPINATEKRIVIRRTPGRARAVPMQRSTASMGPNQTRSNPAILHTQMISDDDDEWFAPPKTDIEP